MSFTAIQIDDGYFYDCESSESSCESSCESSESSEYNYAAYNKSGPDIENQLATIEEYIMQNKKELEKLGGTPAKMYKALSKGIKFFSVTPKETISKPLFYSFMTQFKVLAFANNKRNGTSFILPK